jgi:hypothetical protein
VYPRIYNSSDELLAVLDNIIKDSAKIKRVVNGEFTFAFSAYEKELKSVYFDTDNYILLNEQTFDIKYIDQKHEIDVIYAIQCEHAIYRLEDGAANQYETYAYTGTPAAMLGDIISGTDFSVGTIDFTAPITISINNDISKKALIKQVANAVGGELEYTDNGFTINILATIGNDNGFQVRFGKNLKSITKIIDKRGELKTYYKVDILALKNTNAYIEKGLQGLEVVEIGDTIKIIDSVIGLDIENRILSIEYDPILEVNTKLEIVNTLELITDKITEIETRSVAKEALYNGVYIGPTDGFVAERSDNKAKIVMNATTGLSLYTDNGSGYTENLLITPGGDIEMTGVINITGGTGFTNLTGVGDLAELDTVNETYIDSNSISTSKIQANAIVGSKILAGTIDASKINVTTLDAISADVGTLTAGTINGLNIYGANIDIEEDVKIGQKLKLLDPTNAVAVEMSAFRIFTSGGLTNSLLLAESSTLNNATGTYTKTDLPRIDAFVTKTFLYGDLYVQDDIDATGNISTTYGITGPTGGFVYTYNSNGEKTTQIGTNGSMLYVPGLIFLYNGKNGDSERRITLAVDVSTDKGYIDLYRGDVLTAALSSTTTGGHLTTYDSAGDKSTYLGANNSESGAGLLFLYNAKTGSERRITLGVSDTNDKGYASFYRGDILTTTLNSTSTGGYFRAYDAIGDQSVYLGVNAFQGGNGFLVLFDGSENQTAELYVDETEGGALNLRNGANHRVRLFADDTYGSFLDMYNNFGTKIVRLGSSSFTSTVGRLELFDINGAVRASLRVSTSVDDGRIDIYTAAGAKATIYFDGSNLRVSIGGTNYTLTKT